MTDDEIRMLGIERLNNSGYRIEHGDVQWLLAAIRDRDRRLLDAEKRVAELERASSHRGESERSEPDVWALVDKRGRVVFTSPFQSTAEEQAVYFNATVEPRYRRTPAGAPTTETGCDCDWPAMDTKRICQKCHKPVIAAPTPTEGKP